MVYIPEGRHTSDLYDLYDMYNLHDLQQRVFPVFDLCYTNPAQNLIAAG